MKAMLEREGRLVWDEAPKPEPGPGEVLMKIFATAANRADLMQRAGRYPPPPGASEILGLECAGKVEKVGAGVNEPAVGEEVCALLAGGGYAQYTVCPATHTLPVPSNLTVVQAAALPEVFATAWLNLRLEGELRPGERVLVHAAASGVGTAALQLCAAWGNPVFATVGSAEKEERCRELGAGATANRREGPWKDKVRDWGGADVIVDPVGGSYLESNIAVLNPKGRLVVIGLMGGAEGTLSLGRMLVKRLTLRGSVLRSRSREEKNAVIEGLRREVWPLFDEQVIAPIIDRILPLEQVQEAHRAMQNNETVGKIVLRVPF